MVIVEKRFPRGGTTVKDDNKPKEKIIFGALQKKLKKPKSKKPKSNNEDDDFIEEANLEDNIETVSAELLNYGTIQDGMNIMGMVKAVDQLYLSISLPGRMTARVSALEISESYTKATRKFLEDSDNSDPLQSLKDMYKIGQIVYGRVQEVKQHLHNRTDISMTLKPAEVHADVMRVNVKKGFIFNGAIEEVQEHGYIIESGIKGMRAFLPREKSTDKQEKNVGELIYLTVKKITQDKLASTCICCEKNINTIKIKKQLNPIIDYILPTTIVEFHVKKHLKDGLQGTIMNGVFSGYINEHQLSEPLVLPEDIELNAVLQARVLYVMPLTKLVYLTLNLHKIESEKNYNEEDIPQYKRGDIIENAQVFHAGTGGIIMILDNKFKGLISYKSIKSVYKGNYDQDELLKKYAKKTKHKVRVLNYDFMDSLYICTDNEKVVNEKYFSIDDFKPGDFVSGIVLQKNEKIAGYIVQIGNVKGIIEGLFLAPTTRTLEDNSKVRCRVLSLNNERKYVYLTSRPEYMSKTCKILTSLEKAKIGAIYTGTVAKCNKNFLLIKFFNEVKGVLHINSSDEQKTNTFYEGQTTEFKVVSKNNEQLTLALIENSFKLGEICPVTVVGSLEAGLEINIFVHDGDETEHNTKAIKGLIPIRLLSDYMDLVRAKLHMLTPNTEIEAVSFGKNIFSLRDVDYFKRHITKNLRSINTGEILKAYVKNATADIIELMIPLSGFSKFVKVHWKMLLVNVVENPNIIFAPEQVIYVKVLGRELLTNTISVSAKLTDVWDSDLSSTGLFVESYLSEVAEIKSYYNNLQHPIAQYSIGDKINAQFIDVDAETGNLQFIVPKTKITAVVKRAIVGSIPIPKSKQIQECIILWIDYSNQLLLVSNKSGDIAHITNSTEIPTNLKEKTGVNAKVLLKMENIFICSLKKGQNPLIFCPTRLHFNDFEHIASNIVKEGDFCRLAFVHETKPIAVLEMTWKTFKDMKRKRKAEKEEKASKNNLKKFKILENEKLVAKKMKTKGEISKKIKNNNANVDGKMKTENRECFFFEDKMPVANFIADRSNTDKKQITEKTHEVNQNRKPTHGDTKKLKPVLNSQAIKLPGVENFWSTDLNQLIDNSKTAIYSDGEDDDDDEDNIVPEKRKKLTAGEKFKLERADEERLRAIEEKLADPNQLPESVDQFDRLLISAPNNSKHWINYMVFHLQGAEVDKARAVAKRAIKTISFRHTDELLNIWVALLNLELRYGGKETFDETFKEALSYNEPLNVYLRTLEILTGAKKTEKLVEVIGVVTRKFKAETEIWKAVANAYFSEGMTERAQQTLHKALASLPEREHVNTIVAFANLNHRHGQKEMAQTLLDQIVTSYPKRVDVWTQYIDLLVKDSLIDSARAILQRAIIQNIPLKKMRTIFKKYLEFEERFGKAADVEKVKKLAAEYVKKHTVV